jgi:hypothetical protein
MDVDRRATSDLARDHERSHVSTCIHFGFGKLTHTQWRYQTGDYKELDAVFDGQGHQNKMYTLRCTTTNSITCIYQSTMSTKTATCVL